VEEDTRIAVAEERGRVTRELHDVLAHSVSVMTVQASPVRRPGSGLAVELSRKGEPLGFAIRASLPLTRSRV
jgi:nitrate/nitrite-specific signal transduction histidine kinase